MGKIDNFDFFCDQFLRNHIFGKQILIFGNISDFQKKIQIFGKMSDVLKKFQIFGKISDFFDLKLDT